MAVTAFNTQTKGFKITSKRVFFIHGWGGTHPDHWQNWMVSQAKENVFAQMVLMPNPDFPVVHEWISTLFDVIVKPDKNTVLGGHRLGCPAILRFLEKLPTGQKIGKAVLVAGFCQPLKVPAIDGFVQEPFDWKKIKSACSEFIVVHADNDLRVPLKRGQFLADQLGVTLAIEPNGGHITTPQFGPYPRLWKRILK